MIFPIIRARMVELRHEGVRPRAADDFAMIRARMEELRLERAQEFERSLIRECTQAAIAAARHAGRTGGRPPKLTDGDIEAAKGMMANPDIGVTQIAHRLGVSAALLYRYIPAARSANTPGV